MCSTICIQVDLLFLYGFIVYFLVLYLLLFFPLYRTARGDNDGTALSFVTANDYKILKQAEEELTKEFIGTKNSLHFFLFYAKETR